MKNFIAVLQMIGLLFGFVAFFFWAIFLFCIVISFGSDGSMGEIVPFGINLLGDKPIFAIFTIALAIYFMYEIYRLEKQ